MKKILLLFYSALLFNSATAQICDSLVPTFNVDFTGINAGTTWVSPTIQRNGLCCGSISPDVCIDFVFTTDSNTCAVMLNVYYGGPPAGSLFYRICCSDSLPVGNTAYISNPGVHAITFCKPGNNLWYYSLTSFTQCDSIGFDPVCPLILGTNHERELKNFSFYPNPLTSSSILQLNTQLKNAEVVIYDMLGKEMVRKKMSGDKMEIEKGSLESGVYFVRVSTEETQWVQKIIIE